jgi:tetratricopeptide (TPR) repeat protein
MLRRALRAYGEGEFATAERLFTAVLQTQADNFDALHGLGLINFRRGRLDAALALIQAALQADLDRADGFSSLGLVFHALTHFERALKSFDAGLRIAPDDGELLNRRGVALLELGRPHDALESFDRVLAAAPNHLEALGNRGNALIKLNRAVEALASYDRALAIAPDNAQLLTNRAAALRRLDRPHEAMMSARSALVCRPDFAQAKFVEAAARLTLGDFSGWRGYEARWSVGFLAGQRRGFSQPLWLGAPSLSGKTILLHAEQGFGDTIQFARYAPLLAGRGANVILEVQPALKRLLAATPGVAAVTARGETLPSFDFHCPLLSLPLALGTEPATIPAAIPYIVPSDDDIARWRQRLPERKPLVGLVWSGERSHDNDLNRSLRLEALSPLLGLNDVTFVSLQHEVREVDSGLLHQHPAVIHVGDQFHDFADTAAAIAPLDAVISADTAVAHLAGAMGKPLILLLPFGADFRWLRERNDSPWYPTARLYRQPAFGDWASVVATVRQDLMRPRTERRSAQSQKLAASGGGAAGGRAVSGPASR